MNYRHAFHAGNFADVMKHVIFVRILVALARKPAAFRVIDTHAGRGRYNLGDDEAERTGEWRGGIGRLASTGAPGPVATLLAPYLDQVLPSLRATPPAYPGSPLLAASLTRSQDRIIAVEKHPHEFRILKALEAGDRRLSALEMDGWTALKSLLPPPERRGVILVDPPFESPDEFARLLRGLTEAYRRWPSGCFALWYPVKDQQAVTEFADGLRETAIRRILRLELHVDRIDPEAPLAGTGMIVVNPPWTLETETATILPWLATMLARGPRTSWRADWITPE